MTVCVVIERIYLLSSIKVMASGYVAVVLTISGEAGSTAISISGFFRKTARDLSERPVTKK
jgi:hypothetical protein